MESIRYTGDELFQGGGSEASFAMLSRPIVDLVCRLHFQIGN